jgi:transcriptional regulator
LACKDIHWLYFKVVNNSALEKQKLEEIECYKDISKVMDTLQKSVKARLLIGEKVMELEGVVQKGELLKRALPDRKILKQNTK